MNNKIKLILISLAILGAVINSSAFIVNEWEVALKLRFGKIVDSDYQAGLHWKIPFIEQITLFDGRIQTLDANPERFLTIEKKDVIVDSFAKWRINNVAQYFRSTGGDAVKASRLLSERINTSLRDEFGKRTIKEVVSGERSEIMALLAMDADEKASELGVEILDVRVKRIDLPAEVSESVYDRMRAERQRVAADLRALGGEAAERIRADADRQRTILLAEAYRESELLRGSGDALATEIYASAFNQDRDFYSFYRSLSAYRKIFNDGRDMMVIKPDSEFFRFFGNKSGTP